MQAMGTTAAAPLLEVRNLSKSFAAARLFGPAHRVVAAENVSFRIEAGEAVALVGQSGSGKSTIARLVLRLERPDGGEIRLDGDDVLSRERRRASLRYRGRVQMIFQDPFGSLNPVHTVAHHLMRPLLRHRSARSSERGYESGDLERLEPRGRDRSTVARARAIELLRTVGLEPAEEFIDRHPYELSGGQRQRVAIARALAVGPDLLVADEPTSMLDVAIRIGVLNLLATLKREQQLAILLITHDLASARYLADRILVLYRGRVVEDGPSAAVVESPAHPYTRALLSAIADVHALGTAAPARFATTSDAAADGCPFAPRCPDVLDVCSVEDPVPRSVQGRRVRCHLYPAGEPSGGS